MGTRRRGGGALPPLVHRWVVGMAVVVSLVMGPVVAPWAGSGRGGDDRDDVELQLRRPLLESSSGESSTSSSSASSSPPRSLQANSSDDDASSVLEFASTVPLPPLRGVPSDPRGNPGMTAWEGGRSFASPMATLRMTQREVATLGMTQLREREEGLGCHVADAPQKGGSVGPSLSQSLRGSTEPKQPSSSLSYPNDIFPGLLRGSVPQKDCFYNLETVGPLLRQLQKDRFPTPESGAWPTTKRVLKILGAIAGGVSYTYVTSILFTNDPGVATLLGYGAMSPTNRWGIVAGVGSALVIPETVHAYKAIQEVVGYFHEERGLKKTTMNFFRWLSELGVVSLSAGMTYKIFRIWLDIGDAGPVEFWTNAPLFAPLTFLHTWVPARNLLHKTWNYFSRGATEDVRAHRVTLVDRFAAANRAIIEAPTEDLLALTSMIEPLTQQLQDQDALNSHGHLLLLPLLYGLYHLGEGYDQRHSSSAKKHPLGYRLTQWAGRLLPALGSAGYWLAAKYVMSKSLDLVTEDYTYSPSSSAQDVLIYTYTVGLTGYILATTGKLLGDQLTNIYSWFSGYNPNTVDSDIDDRPLNMGKLRGSSAAFSQLFSMLVALPAGAQAVTGAWVEGLPIKGNWPNIWTIALFSSIGYGAAGNESFGESVQNIISAITHKKGKGIRGRLRHAFTQFLADTSERVKELSDAAVESLHTLLSTSPSNLTVQIYDRLREATLTYCPDRIAEFERLWSAQRSKLRELLGHGDVEMADMGAIEAQTLEPGVLQRIATGAVSSIKVIGDVTSQLAANTARGLWHKLQHLNFFGW